MNLYILASAIIFLALGIVWKKDDFVNALIKILLIVMAIIGAIIYLQSVGYIVKA